MSAGERTVAPRAPFRWLASFENAHVDVERPAGLRLGDELAAEPGGAWWAETPREEWPKDEPLLLEELNEIWDEVWGDRRQELVIIGQDLDQPALTGDLDACLLTDSEMQSGPKSWLNLDDPFGPWDIETADLE